MPGDGARRLGGEGRGRVGARARHERLRAGCPTAGSRASPASGDRGRGYGAAHGAATRRGSAVARGLTRVRFERAPAARPARLDTPGRRRHHEGSGGPRVRGRVRDDVLRHPRAARRRGAPSSPTTATTGGSRSWRRASALDGLGVVVDFEHLKEATAGGLPPLPLHRHHEPPALRRREPVGGGGRRYFFHEVRKAMGEEGEHLRRVRVWEAPGCSATYRRSDGGGAAVLHRQRDLLLDPGRGHARRPALRLRAPHRLPAALRLVRHRLRVPRGRAPRGGRRARRDRALPGRLLLPDGRRAARAAGRVPVRHAAPRRRLGGDGRDLRPRRPRPARPRARSRSWT